MLHNQYSCTKSHIESICEWVDLHRDMSFLFNKTININTNTKHMNNSHNNNNVIKKSCAPPIVKNENKKGPRSYFDRLSDKWFVPTNIKNDDEVEISQIFWLLYCIVYGIFKFTYLPIRNRIIEQQIRIEWIELLKIEKNQVKNMKLDKLINLESQLTNYNNPLNETIIQLIVQLYNIPCIIVSCNKHYWWGSNNYKLSSDKLYIIQLSNLQYNSVCFRLETIKIHDVINWLENHYFLSHYTYENPLRSIDTYKLVELIEIFQKYFPETSLIDSESKKKKSKLDIYQFIKNSFIY